MSSVWTTSAYHSKQCTGRYQDTREDRVDQERTGGAWSAKTYERWGSPGRKQRWQLLTDTDGVGVWPNVSSWIRNESRSRSRYNALKRWCLNVTRNRSVAFVGITFVGIITNSGATLYTVLCPCQRASFEQWTVILWDLEKLWLPSASCQLRSHEGSQRLQRSTGPESICSYYLYRPYMSDTRQKKQLANDKNKEWIMLFSTDRPQASVYDLCISCYYSRQFDIVWMYCLYAQYTES